jgi:hypothetical protein
MGCQKLTYHFENPPLKVVYRANEVEQKSAQRFLSVDPKANLLPSWSPYVAFKNNPVIYVDPDGQFPILSGLAGFAKGLFASSDNFEQEGSSRMGNALRSAWRHEKQSWQITGGLFTADKDKSFLGKVGQIASRFTWELPQTVAGFGYNQLANVFGNVTGVEHYGGATAVKGSGIGWGSVTLGSYISLSGKDPQANVGFGDGSYTFMHEYGHYLQSQRNGFSYLFKYGLPSIMGAEWTEWDANQRAANYFNKREGFNWDSNFYPSGWEHNYSRLPAGGKLNNTRWWEYMVLPAVPFLNLKKPR